MPIGSGPGAPSSSSMPPRWPAPSSSSAFRPRSIVAFWALETDFGANNGNLPVLRSLLTLAYDCRRPEMFREELIYALKVVQRGDLAPGQMIGAWAGEIGQTQFSPSAYFKYAVDFDGDGRPDLIHSAPDVIASSANLLAKNGWKRGQPWLQEVRVPAQPAVGPGRYQDQAPALAMGQVGRDARQRLSPAQRRLAGFAAPADGTQRPGVPRLREFQRLPRMEPVAGLRHHRGVSRDPAAGRRQGPSGQRRAAYPDGAAGDRAAEPAGAARLRGGQGRRQARACDARRRQAGAAQVWAARRRLSDRRADRAPARGRGGTPPRRPPVQPTGAAPRRPVRLRREAGTAAPKVQAPARPAQPRPPQAPTQPRVQ